MVLCILYVALQAGEEYVCLLSFISAQSSVYALAINRCFSLKKDVVKFFSLRNADAAYTSLPCASTGPPLFWFSFLPDVPFSNGEEKISWSIRL